jgi:hypothetical protein
MATILGVSQSEQILVVGYLSDSNSVSTEAGESLLLEAITRK